MRWDRTPPCLTLQWKDNKVVTMLTTIHNANDQVVIKHKEKQNRKWESIDVKKPKVIQTYNAYINGVDKLDQILSTHNLQSKCVQWWKTLFSLDQHHNSEQFYYFSRMPKSRTKH